MASSSPWLLLMATPTSIGLASQRPSEGISKSQVGLQIRMEALALSRQREVSADRRTGACHREVRQYSHRLTRSLFTRSAHSTTAGDCSSSLAEATPWPALAASSQHAASGLDPSAASSHERSGGPNRLPLEVQPLGLSRRPISSRA